MRAKRIVKENLNEEKFQLNQSYHNSPMWGRDENITIIYEKILQLEKRIEKLELSKSLEDQNPND
jgi:hypothetical protein